MESQSRKLLLNKNLQAILVLLIAFIVVLFFLSKNIFLKSNYLLKNLGEFSVDPEIALKNNKPTFLEFYAEWCEVCKEMAPKVSSLKEEYEKDINFVFLNVDNPKWSKYIQKLNVNGIPQVNLFDKKGNLISTFVGKQDEITIRDYIENLDGEGKSDVEVLSSEFSKIKENKNLEVSPRSHG